MDNSTSFPKLYLAFQIAVVIQIFSIEFSIAVSSIAFAAACIFYVILFIKDRDVVFQKNGLEYYFIAYLIALVLMCLFAIYPADAFTNSRRILLVAVVYFMPAILKNEKHLQWFIFLLAIVTALQSGIEIFLYYARSVGRLGYFQMYMTSAGLKMIVLLILIPFILWNKNIFRNRIVLSICGSVILFALILTETRSSWLGFVAGIIILGVLSYRYILIVLITAIVFFVFFTPARLKERIHNMFQTEQTEQVETSSTIKSNVIRVHMWQTGWKMFLDRPILGVGEGHVYEVYRTYTIPIDDAEGGHMHNNYIHLLATHGIIGFIVVMILFVRIVWSEWIILRRKKNSLAYITALGSLAVFAGFFINGMFEYNFGDHEILVFLWMSVGLAIAAGSMKGLKE